MLLALVEIANHQIIVPDRKKSLLTVFLLGYLDDEDLLKDRVPVLFVCFPDARALYVLVIGHIRELDPDRDVDSRHLKTEDQHARV